MMDGSLISVAGLHALTYCERLFYLEEVERIRLADARVYAGRRLHEEIEAAELKGVVYRLTRDSDTLGIMGSVDVLKRRDGAIIPYEHKRGRSAGRAGAREAWDTDRIQIGAYALLAEEALGTSIEEGRVRYHADNVTIRVPIDDQLRAHVRAAVDRARQIAAQLERPPVTSQEQKCRTCSLAPACLPEEARLAADPAHRPVRLLPAHAKGETIHVLAPGARVGRSGERLVIEDRDGNKDQYPIVETGSVILHGLAQITTQALRLCADHDVSVHWMTFGGGLVGSLAPTAVAAQRHLRQFRALDNDEVRLHMAKRLVHARIESQLRFLLRATRGQETRIPVQACFARLRAILHKADNVTTDSALLGYEGQAAALYFEALPNLISASVDQRLAPSGRSRRPPQDRFNALLSYGYGMLYRQVLGAIVAVGLHPGIGFYHRLRSSAHPLALDVMELFRVALVDMSVVGAVNRKTFDAETDFDDLPGAVMLSASGRAKLLEVLERRLSDVWKHDVIGYAMSYARIIELEVRLLEKEWTGEPGLFARLRLR